MGFRVLFYSLPGAVLPCNASNLLLVNIFVIFDPIPRGFRTSLREDTRQYTPDANEHMLASVCTSALHISDITCVYA